MQVKEEIGYKVLGVSF